MTKNTPKNTYFVIKIWDLLQEAGKSDSFAFEYAPCENIPGLTKEGISWTMKLVSLNTESIYATLHNLSCTLDETCESCGASYQRKVHVPSYSARFLLNEEIRKLERETTDEELFLMDARNETIDIEDMIVQGIILEDPLVKRCSSCKARVEALPDDDGEEESVGMGNVIFR